MRTLQIAMPERIPISQEGGSLVIPVAIPALDDVIRFAKARHTIGITWEGTAFGWPADYTSEVNEANATFEEYDENGIVTTITDRRWSPAMFCIGINGVWFISLTWELGIEAEPWLYLEDNYGYHFDETEQVEYYKQRLQTMK